MRYVRMWYIIRHTKTKIIARVHTCTRHACTRADFFFGMYQLETRFARINIVNITMYYAHASQPITRDRVKKDKRTCFNSVMYVSTRIHRTQSCPTPRQTCTNVWVVHRDMKHSADFRSAKTRLRIIQRKRHARTPG